MAVYSGDGSSVATAVVVVGSRPYSEQRLVHEVIGVALLYKLMSSYDGFDIVSMVEFLQSLSQQQTNLFREEEASSPGIEAPHLYSGVWVRPEQVRKWSFFS